MNEEFEIAIVGMSCRFPGARNVNEFWKNLHNGVESISRFSDQELIEAGVSPATLARADYVKAAPVLEDPSLFDAAFFGLSKIEADTLDPQHRLLLELAYAAMEDAACDPGRYPGRIGVFAGSAMNTYFIDRCLKNRFSEEYIPTLIGADKDFLATRISYKLGLRGPSMTIQTACSTSLVAVHLARQSLLSGETDLALAGAVSIRLPHRAGYFYDGGGVVSADGHVRSFDAGATGTVFGSGAGVIVLKRLADALSDRNRIHAVIKGSAVNNDGATKAGYTAPSITGQSDAMVEALANAGVDAKDISFLEAHGSGTPIGDPIEIRALTKAFRNFTQRSGYCAIGAVKSNVGHLDAAAGMAGLIKTVLALKHRRIPPTLHFSKSNREIDLPATPFFVNTAAIDWNADSPRRAGVMSTGMGGTNACLVLEEAPLVAPLGAPRGPQLLPLSAKSPKALDAAGAALVEHFASAAGDSLLPIDNSTLLADTAYTLQTGRVIYPHRRFVVGQSTDDAIAALKSGDPKRLISGSAAEERQRPIVFLLPGVGDHYLHMAAGLYAQFEVFRRAVDLCAEILLPHLAVDIREVLYPSDRPQKDLPRGIDLRKMLGRSGDEPLDPAARKLNQTIHCQPALFTVEYALAQLWIHWGVKPDMIVGHSMGEYVAACLAGVFSLEDALQLIATRAKLVEELPEGAMLAVSLSEGELLPLLGPDLSLSLVNGPGLCVVAGPVVAVEGLEIRLKQRSILFRPVRNGRAFHSRMLDPILDRFAEQARKVRFSSPRLPFISNLTGTWIKPQDAVDPRYWVEHAHRTARFSEALEELWKQPDSIFLEVGPGRTLGVLAMQHPARPKSTNTPVVASLRHDYENKPDAEVLLESVGRLWISGVEIDWEKFSSWTGRRRISLPPYPFERERHWIELDSEPPPAGTNSEAKLRKSDLADWFYVPSWERTCFLTGGDGEGTLRASDALRADALSPHPDPLPRGEGEEIDGSLYRASSDCHDDHSDLHQRTTPGPPLPPGEGIGVRGLPNHGKAPKSFGGRRIYWLIFTDQDQVAVRLKKALEGLGATVIVAQFGEAFVQREVGEYEIRPANLDDYVSLLEPLKKDSAEVLNVIHLGPLSERAQTSDRCNEDLCQVLGFHSLLNLAQAIGETDFSIPVHLGVAVNQIHEVTGEESIRPAMARVLGPCGVMPKEYPNVVSFSVDLPQLVLADGPGDEWIARFLNEFRDPTPGAVIAYRGNYRWLKSYRPVKLPAVTGSEEDCLRRQGLRNRGVYLITGGTGGIGLAMAKYLAGACQARLILTKKTHFPDRTEWQHRLLSENVADSEKRIIKELLELEAMGASVDVFTCDVSDRTGMERVISEIFAKHHVIHGVIHGAGTVSAGLIQAKTQSVADSVMAPKVNGTVILYDLLKSRNVDFLILFSSITSVLMPYAESDYCAANSFLDAFSSFANSERALRTLTINWPGWREVGQLANLKMLAGMESWKEAALNKAILTREGLEVFRRALASKLAQVIVSPEDLNELIEQSNQPPPKLSENAASAHRSAVRGPDEMTAQPEDGVDQTVANIWSKVLGISPIGVHERFADLGGHSLLAMQIVARIRGTFEVNFTLRNFFEGPTVAEMSAFIEDAVTSEIESMSEDEVKRLISID